MDTIVESPAPVLALDLEALATEHASIKQRVRTLFQPEHSMVFQEAARWWGRRGIFFDAPELLGMASASTEWNSTRQGRVASNPELAPEGRALLGGGQHVPTRGGGLAPAVHGGKIWECHMT